MATDSKVWGGGFSFCFFQVVSLGKRISIGLRYTTFALFGQKKTRLVPAVRTVPYFRSSLQDSLTRFSGLFAFTVRVRDISATTDSPR